MPQSWKDLPGSKLANNDKGLKWKKDGNNELRIMDAVPDSQWPSQQIKYTRLKKSGSFLDINGNPVPSTLSGGIPNPDFKELTHIPLSEVSESLLDKYFN